MRTPPPPPDAEPPSLRSMLDGLRYAVSRQELLGSYLIDINAMFFGMPFALFPALADRYGGTQVVGLLWAAPGVGALISMSTSGWAARVHHNGRAIVLAAAGVGRRDRALRPGPHALAGAAAARARGRRGRRSRGIFRGALWNETIPDRMRGRLAGVEMISWSSGPLLGNARAGAAARCSGCAASVFGGGVLVVAGSVALARRAPALLELRLQSGDAERAGAVDDRGPLAEREAQVAARARSGSGGEHRGGDRDDAGAVGSSRANSVASGRRRRWRSTCPAAPRPPGRPRAAPRRGGRAWPAARARTRRTTRRPCAARRRRRAGTASRPRTSGTAWPRARRRPAPPGPVAQPTFQPVTLNVLPEREIVSVRSAIPGSVASGMCSSPSNTRCS